jgi:ferritin-like metal-binding protein YciE
MPVRNPKELFVLLLSDTRQSTERSAKIYQEMSQAAQDPDVKEALESRAWISEKDLNSMMHPQTVSSLVSNFGEVSHR